MLRDIVTKLLFDKTIKQLNEEEIEKTNDFIDNYCKVKELEEVKK